MQIKNKLVVVTGGSSGIGAASATLFAKEGARVVTLSRHPKDVAGMTSIGGDVTRSNDVAKAFDLVGSKLGKVDVLMINAAIVKLAPIADTSDELLDEVVATNLRGAFITLRTAIPHLNDGASIIITTSWLNRVGFAGASVVSMTKAAMRSLVRVAATELSDRRIRVNALCPGAIQTPLWTKLGLSDEALSAAGDAVTKQIPLGRWGSAEEMARCALFLASDASSYLTGTELQADGGMAQT